MPAVAVQESTRPRVEPPYLVIPTKTALPHRCVATNEPISDAEYTTWDLPYIPRWLIVMMFMGPFFLITAPYVRTRCKFKAGVSRAVRRRRFWRRLPLFFLIPIALAIVFYSMVSANESLVMLASWVFFIGYFSLPMLVLFAHPMRVRRSRDGLFWISGISPAYLAELDAETSMIPR